ncbi:MULTISPECIES: thioesterase family protein [unclassified Micromonospora]|uniref:acyl-CoA thioesterase n=1 Tax=Micromonospora TaxID=1873 RepID=UPI0022B5FBD2|nr:MULTISPECIES: thioesterase family protein [unclassified Micromonospora]MCZ7419543.1 thioesterase family protein [Verrucosispora sp. WMMA2121]WBB93173.1 thioesterase family protein [Verrucosispora sp. WMMC514]
MSNAVAEQPAVEYGHVEPAMVHFDDLDALGILHNARYALLLERALTAYWSDRGVAYQAGRASTPDVFHAVREFTISYLAPVTGTGPVAVHFWLEHLGTSSARYAFRFHSLDGTTTYAEGHRTVVRLDPATLRPAPWTDTARAVASTLLRS